MFVEKGHGCRCVADEPWVTVAETCELALALLTSGQAVRAMELFSWIHKYRHDSGAYWMGYQMAEDIPWPAEMPAWTAGAVLLAADALSQVTPASRLFLDVLDENATLDVSLTQFGMCVGGWRCGFGRNCLCDRLLRGDSHRIGRA